MFTIVDTYLLKYVIVFSLEIGLCISSSVLNVCFFSENAFEVCGHEIVQSKSKMDVIRSLIHSNTAISCDFTLWSFKICCGLFIEYFRRFSSGRCSYDLYEIRKQITSSL